MAVKPADPVVYLAGPMRGIPEFNFPAFASAAHHWRSAGVAVVSPAEHDLGTGFDPTGLTGDEDLAELDFDLTATLLWDLEQVAKADVIVLLPGWEQSSGVRAELATAAALGKHAIEHGTPDQKPRPAATFLHPQAQSGEVRVTNTTTGGEKGSKLARFDLIPAGPLWELAEHYGRGAEKYASRNWERGYDWSLTYAALMRHLLAFWGGEDTDAETGSKHIIAVAWHAFVLAQFMDTHPELDNRPTA